MPALSITSLDRLIEPSSSFSKESSSSLDQSAPFSFYPPLYATPSQQRPPSPSSFSPSPYVLNFKRRCPVQQQPNVGTACTVETSTDSPSQEQLLRMDAIQGDDTAAVSLAPLVKYADISPNKGAMARKSGELLSENEVFEMELDKRDAFKNVPAPKNKGLLNKDEHFCNAFSATMKSGTGCEHSTVPCSVSSLVVNEEVEFFDAPDSVFSESATEDDVCSSTAKPGGCLGECGGSASSLEAEVARRMKAEEVVTIWQKRWNEMAKRCSLLGLSISSQTGEVLGNTGEFSEMLTQELVVARLVGGAIASAVVRAEKDEEFESILGAKNWEISRLGDKLQYLELVNREMSQRNQEVIELTQRRRKRRQWRQKFALGGLCAAFCIGTAGLVCYKFVPLDQVKGWANLFEKSSAGQFNSADACRE